MEMPDFTHSAEMTDLETDGLVNMLLRSIFKTTTVGDGRYSYGY